MNFSKICLLWLPSFLFKTLLTFSIYFQWKLRDVGFLSNFSIFCVYSSILILWQKLVNAWVIFRKTNFFLFFSFLFFFFLNKHVLRITMCQCPSSVLKRAPFFLPGEASSVFHKPLRNTQPPSYRNTKLQMKQNCCIFHWDAWEQVAQSWLTLGLLFVLRLQNLSEYPSEHIYSASLPQHRGVQKNAFGKGLDELMVGKFPGGYWTWEFGCNVWLGLFVGNWKDKPGRWSFCSWPCF